MTYTAYRNSEETVSESRMIEMFCEYVDELTEDIVILGMTFTPSRILKETDPIAFNEEMSRWNTYVAEFEEVHFEDFAEFCKAIGI